MSTARARAGRVRPVTLTACALAVAATTLAACAPTSGADAGATPVTVSREALGTVVTVTAWGADERTVRAGIDDAFKEMRAIERELDPYDAASDVARMNAAPSEWHALPPSATEILDRIRDLRVQTWFSPTLFGVTKLYGFGGDEAIPDPAALFAAVRSSGGFERDGDRGRFAPIAGDPPGMVGDTGRPGPGLDFGGAAKGLALDRAVARLRATPGVRAALISTVSSTAAFGAKPDGEPWRIGIEDPRATGSVLAVVSGDDTRTLNVSTSGDYQLYFERDGVRYHHILDPKTGRPARGIRSLTVFGRLSGMDADILSTALFVAGRDEALAYARRAGIGVYLVDADGSASSHVPAALKGVSLEVEGEPKP